jgi:hypothetical protein
MGAPAVAAVMIGGGLVQAYGQQQEAKSQANYYGYLASTARQNADLAGAAGEANARAVSLEEADQMQRSGQATRQMIGEQKAAMVTGVGAGSRSAQDIVSDTLTKGGQDAATIRLNAELKRKSIFMQSGMEQFNLQNQAGGYGIAGSNVRAALPWQQASTLLGSAGQAGSSWYQMNRFGKGY